MEIATDGWLFGVRALHSRRAPGKTCLAALRAAEQWGVPAVAHNSSKGCGSVVRAAPVGLFRQPDDVVFDVAVDTAKLTHGHPSASLSAGYLAAVVASLVRDEPLTSALARADGQLRRRDDHQEVANALAAARALAARGRPRPEELETLGTGWAAEEALAIAVCCALSATHFADGIILAANHSGKSNGTAAIAGNLLGAQFGEGAIPAGWLNELELRDEISRIADDVHASTTGAVSADALWDRYPGY